MPTIIPIIGAIAAAASAGTSIYELTKGQPSPPPISTKPQPLTPQQSAAAKASIGQSSTDILEQDPGVSPDYVAQFGTLFSGNAGQPGISGTAQAVANQLFGLGGGATVPGQAGPVANPGPPVSNFTPAGLTTAPSSGFVSSGLSDLADQIFQGAAS